MARGTSQHRVRSPHNAANGNKVNSPTGKSSKCLPVNTCLSSIGSGLLHLLFDTSVKDDHLGGSYAQWDLPSPGKKPRPMVQTSGLPVGWREVPTPTASECAEECEELPSNERGESVGPLRRGIPSCPSMPLLCDTEQKEKAEAEGFERLPDSWSFVDDQLIELISLPGDDSPAHDLSSLTRATVLFEPEMDEYALQWNEDVNGWTMKFCFTGLQPGMHKFYFKANGERVLSHRYAVEENSNVALFSDSLRRYIVCHTEECLVRTASGVTVESDGDMSRQTSHTRLPSNTSDWSRQNSPVAFSPGGRSASEGLRSRQASPVDFGMRKKFKKQVTGLPSRQQSPADFVQQAGLTPEEERQLLGPGPSLWLTPNHNKGMGQRRHTVDVLYKPEADAENDEVSAYERELIKLYERVPVFTQDVYESVYDPELRLRLDAKALRLDWSKAPVGGPCRNLQFWAGSSRMGKQTTSTCEDACFVSPYALGVADGVGGMSAYSGYGVNSAQFSSDIMEICARVTASAERGVRPKEEVAEAAVEAVRAAQDVASFGASTVTVAYVDGDEMGVANLGDSGFLLLRRQNEKLTIVARSSEQHHRWNCPYQLANLPPALAEKFPEFASDTAEDCDTYNITLQAGDLLLLFSDGVRDNLHDHEILHLAECALAPAVAELLGLPRHKTSPESVAQAITFAAYERSCDPRARVPFASYCREHGYELEGGKEDDITVVAAWVVQDVA